MTLPRDNTIQAPAEGCRRADDAFKRGSLRPTLENQHNLASARLAGQTLRSVAQRNGQGPPG